MNQIYIIILFILVTFNYDILRSQNLLVDGSFEEGCICDNETEETSIPSNWRKIAGNPRFLNPNCPMPPDQKTFIHGMRLPNAAAGKVYAAIGIDFEGEYLEGKLNAELEEGKRYWVKMRIRLPVRFCNTPIDELGVILTDSLFESTEQYINIDMPSIKLKTNDQTPISDQNQWIEISAIYNAKGNERHLIIGNFKDNNVSNFKNREEKIIKQEANGEKKEKLCTYVFIDMVTVEEFKEISLKNFSKTSELKIGERFVMKDVEFETGLEKLKESSFSSLDALAKKLVDNSSLQIEISGHTDNTGDENTNRFFSKSRAQSVVNYLVSKGAKASQITVEGKGSSMNIAQNTNEKNREKNRRIELKVMSE